MSITAGLTSLYGGGTGTHAWKFFSEMLYSNILEEFYPKLLLHDMGQHITIPGHRGKTVHVRAWTKVNPVEEIVTYDRSGSKQGTDTSKDEWEAPDSATPMNLTDYFGTLHGFGGYFVFDDIHMDISEVAETLSTGARQLGAGYAEYTEDETLKRLLDCADGTATLSGVPTGETPIKLGSNGKAWGSVTASDYMTVSDIYRVGTEFEDPSASSELVYAFPDGYYRGIIHPRVKHDLLTYVNSNQPNMVDWIQTTRGQGLFEGGKIPVLNNVAIETSAFDTTDPWNSHGKFDQASPPAAMTSVGLDTGVTGYMSLFFAPGSFSNLDLANGTPSLIIQPFGSGGATGDPLKRAMTVGIKGYQSWVMHQVDKRFALMASVSSI